MSTILKVTPSDLYSLSVTLTGNYSAEAFGSRIEKIAETFYIPFFGKGEIVETGYVYYGEFKTYNPEIKETVLQMLKVFCKYNKIKLTIKKTQAD